MSPHTHTRLPSALKNWTLKIFTDGTQLLSCLGPHGQDPGSAPAEHWCQFQLYCELHLCKTNRQYPNIGTWKKMKFSFFGQRHALSTSFDIFVVTYVTNFLPKLVDMLIFSAEKTEFPFFEIPYFRVLPTNLAWRRSLRVLHWVILNQDPPQWHH